MGFSSYECVECNHSILNPYSTNDINSWMKKAVVIGIGGDIVVGEYDGYGRVVTGDQTHSIRSGEPCVYHHACWLSCGKPKVHKPSKIAEDQGFFFDKEHDIEPPPLPEEKERDTFIVKNAFTSRTYKIDSSNSLIKISIAPLHELEMFEEWEVKIETLGITLAELREGLCSCSRGALIQNAFPAMNPETQNLLLVDPEYYTIM